MIQKLNINYYISKRDKHATASVGTLYLSIELVYFGYGVYTVFKIHLKEIVRFPEYK